MIARQGHVMLLRQHVAEVLRIDPGQMADISLDVQKYESGPDFQYVDLFDKSSQSALRLCIVDTVDWYAEDAKAEMEQGVGIVVDMRKIDDFAHVLLGLLHEAEAEYRQRGAPAILVWNELPGLDFWYVKRTDAGDAGLFHSCCSFKTAWSDLTD